MNAHACEMHLRRGCPRHLPPGEDRMEHASPSNDLCQCGREPGDLQSRPYPRTLNGDRPSERNDFASRRLETAIGGPRPRPSSPIRAATSSSSKGCGPSGGPSRNSTSGSRRQLVPGRRQVAEQVDTGGEEIGDHQHAPPPARRSRPSSGGDVGLGQLEEAGLDDRILPRAANRPAIACRSSLAGWCRLPWAIRRTAVLIIWFSIPS